MKPAVALMQATIVPAIILAAWEAAVRFGAGYEFLPAPSTIVLATFDVLRSDDLPSQVVHSLTAIVTGWLVASLIGVLLGIIFGLSRQLREWAMPSIEVLRPLPAIAFLPVAILLFNFSMRTELLLITYACIWPVFVNTLRGVVGVPSQLRAVAEVLKLGRVHTVISIIIPAAAPSILVGCRVGLGLALIMAIVAEMLANPAGLGYAVISELQAMQAGRMFAYVLLICLLSILINYAMAIATSLLLRHHSAPSGRD
jgi:sulfonate transport system permease protein